MGSAAFATSSDASIPTATAQIDDDPLSALLPRAIAARGIGDRIFTANWEDGSVTKRIIEPASFERRISIGAGTLHVAIQARMHSGGLVGKAMADLAVGPEPAFDSPAHRTALLGEARSIETTIDLGVAHPNAIDSQVGGVLRNVDRWVLDATLRASVRKDLTDAASLYRSEYENQ